jgi:thiamine pyrophosphokinase
MIAHIFTGPLNYDVSIVEDIQKDDLVIGADQGALFLLNNNIRCDIALGDFDSITETEKHQIEAYANEMITHSSIKDFTDTYLAVEEAFARNVGEIILYGGIGKRFDHSYANVKLLELGTITLKTNTELMYVLDPGSYEIENRYSYISFFALEEVKGLSLQGFFYELDNIILQTEDPLCISNQGQGTLSFSEGTLLVIHQNE